MKNINVAPAVNNNEIEKRINAILTKKTVLPKDINPYKFLLGIIDLTTLEGSDTNERVLNLCIKACEFSQKGLDLPDVAAVCVYPPFVKLAKNTLQNTGVNVASVAGSFPSGQSPLYIKLKEVEYAIDEGADEIDMVISRGKFLQGEYEEVFDEIAAIKEICKYAHLKVILETGELLSLTNVKKASDLAILAGADFIKTSTGKITPAATESAFLVMLDSINEYYQKTGKMIGIKPAGGISDPDQALNYYKLVNATLGEKWLDKHYFRVGASRLADKLLAEIAK